IWIGPALEKHLRHLIFAGRGAVPKRHAPSEDDVVFVAAAKSSALVGIESKIQKHLQDFGSVMTRRDAQKATGIEDRIDQCAFCVPGTQPSRVAECDGGPGSKMCATAQQ